MKWNLKLWLPRLKLIFVCEKNMPIKLICLNECKRKQVDLEFWSFFHNVCVENKHFFIPFLCSTVAEIGCMWEVFKKINCFLSN